MKTGEPSEWLEFANGDLLYAMLGQQADDIPLNLVAFHAQQSIEKAIKALLVFRKVDFPKTHDLGELLHVLRGHGGSWPMELDKVVELTPLAVQTRYPGFDDPMDRVEVDAAIQLARETLKWVTQQIRPE